MSNSKNKKAKRKHQKNQKRLALKTEVPKQIKIPEASAQLWQRGCWPKKINRYLWNVGITPCPECKKDVNILKDGAHGAIMYIEEHDNKSGKICAGTDFEVQFT